MKIIPLHKEHAESFKQIRLIGLKQHPESFASSFEEEAEQSIQDIEKKLLSSQAITYGAFHEGRLGGIITLLFESKLKMHHKAYIVGLFVQEEFRGLGMAKQLMNTVIDNARVVETVEQLHLTVMADNQPALKLYKKLGFRSYAHEPRALKVAGHYYDEIHMVLPLK
ncbi:MULTISPECIES: GNAT family N-acetyltransferase [Cytobacillus]|uniref:GNAT family N-acetyltransferase n=1 Tax=Cytobacillus stercorigallinarum TaxID=2762240 RepID=A0ABR8QSL2_9BACI|nr:GNAT family N-acetyltransferase [Cytobacillus stercorigallinarum]MBD7938515.1 GNAT family N-acetyltransferase [Cytobacillus stercorigallinarum]